MPLQIIGAPQVPARLRARAVARTAGALVAIAARRTVGLERHAGPRLALADPRRSEARARLARGGNRLADAGLHRSDRTAVAVVAHALLVVRALARRWRRARSNGSRTCLPARSRYRRTGCTSPPAAGDAVGGLLGVVGHLAGVDRRLIHRRQKPEDLHVEVDAAGLVGEVRADEELRDLLGRAALERLARSTAFRCACRSRRAGPHRGSRCHRRRTPLRALPREQMTALFIVGTTGRAESMKRA